MSQVVKWALLAAAVVALIALIVALPFVQFIDFGQFGSAVSTIVEYAGTALQGARGLINNFFTPFGRNVITGILYYLIGKFFITMTIKITSWIYHFVFRG